MNGYDDGAHERPFLLREWLKLWNWCQFDFAPWFSKLWITIVLWGIAIGAVIVGIIWDREFAASLAPSEGLEASYKSAGVIISLAAVFLLTLATLGFRHKAYVTGGASIALWIAVSVASYSHSVGVQSIGIQNTYSMAKSGIVEDTVRVDSKADVIATLEGQKAQAIADRDQVLAQHERTIERVYDDGISGISAADNRKIAETELLMDAVRREAKEEIAAIDAAILAEKRDVTSEVAIASDDLEKSGFNPLYTLMGRFLHGESVNDEQITQIAIRFSSYWAALIPFLGLLVPLLFNFHLHMQARKQSIDEQIEKKARDLERARKAAETRKRNANIHDAEFETALLEAPDPETLEDADNDDDDSDSDSEASDDDLRGAAA